MRLSTGWLVHQVGELSSGDVRRIAELGPGPGIALQEMLRTFPQAQVWGVDLSPVMLAQARKRNLEHVKSGRLTLVEGDPASLGRLAPLDLVVATHVLYFWHRPATELAQIHGDLRPGGFLALGYAHCERVIKTLRHEALDWLLICGERHLRLVLRQYIDHYNRQRPHLALGLCPPQPAAANNSGPVLRQQRLNGLINEYHRAA